MAGLGSFAGGLAQGLNTAFSLSRQASEDQYMRQQRERALKQQAIEDEAQAAGAKYLQGVKERFVSGGGNEAEFKPGVHDMLGAYEATAAAHAAKGDMTGFSKAISATEPLRQRARAQAWQSYQMDGDAGKLGAAFYSTIPDGVRVEKYDMVNGTGPDGKAAAPQVRFQLSNGRTVMFKPDEVESFVKRALVDPAKAAELDAKLAAKLFEIKADTDGKIRVEGVKGTEARKTEDVKHKNEVAQIGLRTDGQLKVEDRRTAGNLQEAGVRGGIEANNIRLRQGLQDAEPFTLSEGATRYAIKDGKAVPVASAPKSATGKRMTVPELQAAAVHSFGDPKDGPMGGTRIGGERTTAIAARANEIRTKNPSIPDDQALIQAAGEYGVKFPRTSAPALSLSSASPANTGGWSITRE